MFIGTGFRNLPEYFRVDQFSEGWVGKWGMFEDYTCYRTIVWFDITYRYLCVNDTIYIDNDNLTPIKDLENYIRSLKQDFKNYFSNLWG